MQREEGPIEGRIKADSMAALKAGNRRLVNALRLYVAALKKERIDTMKQPSEADELVLLGRERKRRQESLETYRSAGRDDLAAQEQYEIDMLEPYMPAELADEQLAALVTEAVTACGATTTKEMGKVMAALMPRVAGRADGRRVSEAVRARLAG
jgi:uncharacterized protein YqeY